MDFSLYYHSALYLFFGILPSALWLLYYVQKDLHPEPRQVILKIFIYGALITVPTFFIQIILTELIQHLSFFSFFIQYPLILTIIQWFFVIALTEELLKYTVVRFAVLSSNVIDEPLDIMLYMVISALGFAALENVLYLTSPLHIIGISMLQTTATLSFIRFIGATFLHTLASALVGYFLVLATLKNRYHTILTITGIALATLLHGGYNFSIITLDGFWAFAVPASIIILLALFIFYDFDEVKKIKGICKL